MDALKLIAQTSMKESFPEFNVGDTVKVSVNIRERREAEFPKHSQ